MSNPKIRVAVDLDATLAKYEKHVPGEVGEPIPEMVSLIQRMLEAGIDVWIFTARICDLYQPIYFADGLGNRLPVDDSLNELRVIKDWCELHIGKVLPVTAIKHRYFSLFIDDRAVSVHPNTGVITSAIHHTGHAAEILRQFITPAEVHI